MTDVTGRKFKPCDHRGEEWEQEGYSYLRECDKCFLPILNGFCDCEGEEEEDG